MKQLLFILFTLLCIGSEAQIKKLTIDFYPSFIVDSKLIIEKKSDGYLMTLEYLDIRNKIKIPDSAVIELDSFLPGYHFLHTSSVEETEVIKTTTDGDTIVQHIITTGCGGITVEGKLKRNKEHSKTFEFWSPNKGTENHNLIELLFNLLFTYSSKLETITYLELLEQYFDFGLGLKKLGENPLTYKLYGTISGNDADELYNFFDSLPADKEILIDMSNFNRMGTMFDKDFFDLSESHPKITWINCSAGAKNALNRSGIKSRRIK